MEHQNVEIEKVEVRSDCYHCGDDCGDVPIRYEGKIFCCTGCKTVYEILQDNDLCTYYDLEKSPGFSLKRKNFDDKFKHLENPEIAGIVYDFFDGKRAIVNLYIPSIHCSSCIWLLENLLLPSSLITKS